jgi:hypothetical protein
MRQLLDALGPHAAVTGRWIRGHDSPAASAVQHYARGQGDVDVMPALIAKRVVDFEPVRGSDAVAISAMPLFFCCMGPELVPLLRGAARVSASADEVFQFFCNALRQSGGQAYYSSTLVAYDRSYLD